MTDSRKSQAVKFNKKIVKLISKMLGYQRKLCWKIV